MPVGPVVRDQDTAEFFDGAAEGKFLLRECKACGVISAPQAKQCASCGFTGLSWHPAAGGASVVSWVVTHTKPDADGTTSSQVVAIAELDEGPWWWSQVTDAEPSAVQLGTRLRIDFDRAGEQTEYVPVFRLA